MKKKIRLRMLSICMSVLFVIGVFAPLYMSKAENEMTSGVEIDDAATEFTQEELEYIKSSGTLKVGYADDNAPISYEEKGELKGISRAIFDNIAQISGLKFEYVALPHGKIDYKYLQKNGFDLVTGVENNEINKSAVQIYMSEPYLSSMKVMVCKEGFEYDATANHSLAIATGSVTFADVVKEKYPNFDIFTYETVKKSFDAVVNGKQDMALVNQYVASYWLASPRYDKLTIVPYESMDDALSFSAIVDVDGAGGMSPEDSALVISIINKSLNQIPAEEMSNLIVREAMDHQYEYTFFDVMYLYRYTLVIGGVLLVIMIAANVTIARLKKRNAEHRRQEEKKLILQQKRYKMIIDNSDEMIYEISLLGESGIASDKIKQKFGWDIPRTVDNLSIKTLSEILHVHPDDSEQFYSSTEGLMINKEVKELQIRLGKSDGTYLWCKVIYLPIIDDGEMVSIVGKIEDVDDSVREKKRLEIKSRTDSLTNLLNKRTFEDEVQAYIEENTAVSSAFIFVDMDFFKNVNDLLGHVMGDQVIKDTAVKLQVIFANCDLVARFGGDEYCIFVKDIPSETLADKLNFAIDKLSDVYTGNGIRVSLTASIGAAYCSNPNVGYVELLECADKAVYQAKENGRNRFVISYL